MCMLPGNSYSFIFLGSLALLNLEFRPFIKYSYELFVSATPLKPLHRISRNFVVI